jgi:hypothetical protein
MTYELVLRPEIDIRETYNWYEGEEEGLGGEFLVVEEILNDFIDRPMSYQIVIGMTRRIVLPKFPYSLFITLVENVITVTACIHDKRHPREWKRRR